MSRGSRIAWLLAVLFTLVNLAGVVFAMLRGERAHTGIHAGLLLVGAYFVWFFARRRVAAY